MPAGLTETLVELDKTIEAAGAELPGHESISSIKGIGARCAAILLSGIGNVDDFESADKLAAYVGIVPKVSQSNDTDNRGRITKRGNKLMRTTLVQCTLVAKRYSGYARHRDLPLRAKADVARATTGTGRMTHRLSDATDNHRLRTADPVTTGCAHPPSTRNAVAFTSNRSVFYGSLSATAPVLGAMPNSSRTLDTAVAPTVCTLSR